MGNNGSKTAKLSPQEEAILKVLRARDSTDQYQKQVTIKWLREHDEAKKLLAAGKKEEAKRALRRRKYLKDIIDKTIEQHDQLLQLAENIRAAERQKTVVDALEAGKNALVQLNKEMGGLKRVEAIMEQSAEAMADEREISDLLGGGLSSVETEVDEEMAALEEEASKEEAGASPLPDSVPGSLVPNSHLPDAPRTNLQPEDVSLPNSSALNSSVPGSPMPDAPKEEPKSEERAKEQERRMLAA